MAPETGARFLVPETVTHFAGKWYRQIVSYAFV